MQQIKIDFDNPGFPQRLDVVENDAQSRFFKAVLYKDGKAYTAPDGATYSIMYRGFGPQNEGWYDTINDGAGKRAACSVSGNVVTCEIARQALRVPGHVSVMLCVTGSNGYMLHGWPIDCNCRNDSYTGGTSVESFFYITQVTNADWTSAIRTWEELKNMIDPTLSVEGKAADAKETGDAIKKLTVNAKNKLIICETDQKKFGLGETGAINSSSYISYVLPIEKGVIYKFEVYGSSSQFLRMGTNGIGAEIGEKCTIRTPTLVSVTDGIYSYEWLNNTDDKYALIYINERTIKCYKTQYQFSELVDLEYYGKYESGDNITELLQKAINSRNSIYIKSGTYYINPISITLNNQKIVGKNVSIINSSSGTETSKNTEALISVDGSNFIVEGITFNANGEWVERPNLTSETIEKYNSYLLARKNTINCFAVNLATRFSIKNCSFTKGTVGLRVSDCSMFCVHECTVEYTNADAFFVTGSSNNGRIEKCTASHCGDDAFSIVADSADKLPNQIIVSNCIAHHTMGALTCLHGSYNTIVTDCIGYEIGRCSIRLGSIASISSDGILSNVRTGHNQTVSNCIIRCSKLCGGNDGANKIDNDFNSVIVQGYESQKAYDIIINNVQIYREAASNRHIMSFRYGTNILVAGCLFNKIDLSFFNCNKSSFSNCNAATSKYIRLENCVDFVFCGNNIYSDFGIWSDKETSTFSPCNVLIYNGNRIKFCGNKYICYASSKSYNILFHPNSGESEKDDNEYYVDTDSVATYNSHKRKIKFDGIWTASNSLLQNLVSALADGQLVINNNNKLYLIKNHSVVNLGFLES